MKLKKLTAMLSAITMMASSSMGSFPAMTANAAEPAPRTVRAVQVKTTEDTTSDGWEYTASDESVTITRYSGSESALKVPETIAGLPVTEIASRAFSGNTALNSLDLGNVKCLGHHILENCSGIKSLTIPKSVTETDSDWGDYGVLEGSFVETVTFEKGIANIPAFICKNASSVTKIVLPEKEDTVDGYTIGTAAFEGTSLTELSLPNSLTGIGNYAFRGCTALTSVTVPDLVTNIGVYAFADCTQLTALKLGASLTTLGHHLLDNSTSVKELTIPKRVKEVESDWGSYGALEGSAVETITFENGIENIPAYICKNATSITKAVFPEKEDTIDGYAIGTAAFEGTSLTELALPESLTSIEDYAFKSCVTLTSAVIPANVRYVGSYSFAECKRLTAFQLGDLTSKLGHHMLEGSSGVLELTITKNVKEVESDWGSYGALEGSFVETVTFAKDIENIPAYICKNASSVTKVVLPEKDDTLDGYAIGKAAFEGTSLTEITLPETLTSIDDYAFQSCASLTGITVPNNVTYVGSYAFGGCKRLKELTLGTSVKKLGHHMLDGSAFLKEITIPKSVTEVDSDWSSYGALEGSSVETVTFEKGIANIPAYICKNASAVTKVVIPENEDTVDGYAIGTAAFEGTSLTELALPESLTSIDDSAFSNCVSLTSVTVPKNVTYVGSYSFGGCKRLTAFQLGASVKKLGHHILDGAVSLKELTIPNSVTEVDSDWSSYGALEGSSVETVIFEKEIPNIPAYICKNAASVKNVVLPEKTDLADGYAIGTSAFEGTSLVEVTLPESLTSVNDNAFRNCERLTKAVIPDGVGYIGSYSFAGCKRLNTFKPGAAVTKFGHHVLEGAISIKELTVPKTVTEVDSDWGSSGVLEGSSVETLYFQNGAEQVPDYFAMNAEALKTVYLPDSCESIGSRAFSGCKNLFSIVSDRTTFMFQATSFTGCDKLSDSRLTVFDLDHTSLTANADQASVNGIVSYTLKYKLMPSLAGNVTDRKLVITIPDQLTLLMDSVTGKNVEIDAEQIQDGEIPVDADEGEIRFSARVTEIGNYNISASMRFYYNNSDWDQPIGSLDVECPHLTLAVPETVNELTANVYGMAQKGQDVSVYVNDTLAGTLTASTYTGRYQGTVKLPEGKSGDIYEIYAKAGENVSETVKTVYASEKPVVKQVVFRYNQHSDTAQTLDITDVLLRGVSPVVSFNPAYSTSYEITATNNEKIDRMFVTSTKGDHDKYLEAFYNKETGTWIADGYFDPQNHSYVPGTLNICIMEKKTTVLDEKYNYEADQKFAEVPEGFQENSSVEIVNQTDDSMLANVKVSDGNKSETFQMFTSESSDGVYVNGEYVKAADVVKNPEKYGFKNSGTQTINNGKKADYYIRVADNKDAAATILLDSGKAVGDIGDVWSGATILEIIEGDAANNPAVKFANEFITESAGKGLELMFGSGYSNIATGLSFGSDILTYAGQMELANGDTEYEVLSTVLFAAKCFNNFGGTELVLGMVGIEPPFSTIIKAGVNLLLDYADDWLLEWMQSGKHFFGSGHIRFIIDPSGVICEAVLGNTVEGATVTVYFQNPETGEAVKWNAEDYDQFNPLLTNAEGQYLWDVPEGKWKVVCTKDGYEKAESEWMEIPPVRTNVNILITSKEAPMLTAANWTKDGLTLKFSKFIDIATLTENALSLEGYDGKFTISPLLLNEGDLYADTFVLTGNYTDALKSVTVSKDVLSYAGTAVKAGTLAVKDNRFEMGDLNRDFTINLKDVVALRRYIAGGWDAQISFVLADVNGDGTINLKDVVMLRRYIAGGWDVSFQSAS